jgi:hypothetical protein
MRALRLCAALLVTVPMLFCGPRERWTDFHRGSTDCVIAILHEQATPLEVSTFLDGAVSAPRADGKGLNLRPGISSVIKVATKSGSGYEICFSGSATIDEKASVKKLLAQSPVVMRLIDVKK